MKDLFIPYNLAFLAKEKGFVEPCLAAYIEICTNKHEFMLKEHWERMDEEVVLGDNLITPAPLYQQIIDFLREKYGIFISQDLTAFDTNALRMNKDGGPYIFSRRIKHHAK